MKTFMVIENSPIRETREIAADGFEIESGDLVFQNKGENGVLVRHCAFARGTWSNVTEKEVVGVPAG